MSADILPPQSREPDAQPVEVEINDRRRVERQRLAEDQPADDRDAQRPAQFRAVRRAQRQGQAAKQGGHRRHGDRAEAQQARLDRSPPAAVLPSLRSASRAKSIIMIAFFFTMPISRMMPIKRDDAQIGAGQTAAPASAPTPADGSVERMVIG